ncbi:MAG: hypothetical protein AAFY26_19640 [Cyanobacteria bacterium J06638_22]
MDEALGNAIALAALNLVASRKTEYLLSQNPIKTPCSRNPNESGLTQFDDFWGALRPKNHQTALVFHRKRVSPINPFGNRRNRVLIDTCNFLHHRFRMAWLWPSIVRQFLIRQFL